MGSAGGPTREADEGPELDTQVIVTGSSRPAKSFDLVVGEPHFVSLADAVSAYTDCSYKLLQIPWRLRRWRPTSGVVSESTALVAGRRYGLSDKPSLVGVRFQRETLGINIAVGFVG